MGGMTCGILPAFKRVAAQAWISGSEAVTDINQENASYEDRLGDALETLLEEGADTLQQLADGLTRLGIAMPQSASHTSTTWTAQVLAAELHRLGK
jgi:hypothetical protein